MKSLFLLCYCMILVRAKTLEDALDEVENLDPPLEYALKTVADQRAFVEDLQEFYENLGNGLIADPASYFRQLAREPYFEQLVQDHTHDTDILCYYRIERVKAFMRECGIKQKYDYGYAELSDLPNFSIYACTDMQILMLLLGIDCPDYKDYFFTSKGELLNDKILAPIDLWGFLDHYGIEYNQRGPKFNSQTLGVGVSTIKKEALLNVLDIFISTKDEPNSDELEVKSINAPQDARFVKKLMQTYLPEELKTIQENNGCEIYISYNCSMKYTGPSGRTAIAWGLHAAVHGLETPAAVFTGSIDRQSGRIGPIGGMHAKHAAAKPFDLPMIVPQENLYKRNGMFRSWLTDNRYSNVKPASSLPELFSIASSMKPFDGVGFNAILGEPRYTVKPGNTTFARLLSKLPTKK